VKPPETSCVDTFADNTAISMPVKTFYRPSGRKHKPTQPYSPPTSPKCKK